MSSESDLNTAADAPKDASAPSGTDVNKPLINASHRQLVDTLISLVDHAAAGARKSLRHLLMLAVFAAACCALTVWYFYSIVNLGAGWMVLPILAFVVPCLVLMLGIRILNSIVALPNTTRELWTTVAEVSEQYWPKIQALEAQRLRGLTKWRTYLLIAKLLWRVRRVHGQGQGLLSGVALIAFVANPIFWGVLLCTAILIVVECVLMLGAVAGHAMFF